MSSNTDISDTEALRDAINETKSFIYVNGFELTVVSFGWFLLSLPLFTIGPATLGVYAAVQSLRENDDELDPSDVWRTVRKRFFSSLLLGLLPFVFGSITSLYLVRFLTTGSMLAGLLTLITGYVTILSLLAFVPTFVMLSRGQPGSEAAKNGYIWVTSHPTLSFTTGLMTLGLAVVSGALLVAFPLVFAGIACAFHVHLVSKFVVDDGERPANA